MQTNTEEIILAPDLIPLLSKENARSFHEKKKELIKETGDGIFEYLELLQFFTKLKEVISGNNQNNILPDKEFVSMVRDEIAKYPKGKFITARGVKFENAEVGTKYDFSQCNYPLLDALEMHLESVKISIDKAKEFLKTVPVVGLVITGEETGETTKVFPPTKTSISSYKITLAK